MTIEMTKTTSRRTLLRGVGALALAGGATALAAPSAQAATIYSRVGVPDLYWGCTNSGSSLYQDCTRILQSRLNQLGYSLSVDGSFGPATDWAVRNFQYRNRLSQDGSVGPQTRYALRMNYAWTNVRDGYRYSVNIGIDPNVAWTSVGVKYLTYKYFTTPYGV